MNFKIEVLILKFSMNANETPNEKAFWKQLLLTGGTFQKGGHGLGIKRDFDK